MEEMNLYKNNKGITIITLVVIIIVMLILVGISLVIGKNKIFTMANNAKLELKISEYKEKIELIKSDIQMENKDFNVPTVNQIKEKLEKEQWASSVEIIIDKEREKVKLTTKEGYIFYITWEKTEYKGKGEVIDTSALEKEKTIELKITEATEKGKLVQITKLVEEDYYTIKYIITENIEEAELETKNWQEIESGKKVEVEYGKTIIARLFYGLNYGIKHKLSIENTIPVVVAKNIDTSNIVRKTEKNLSELFEITWGSDGIGVIEYEITGNLIYEDMDYTNNTLIQLGDLELGNYKVKCKAISPTGVKAEATKNNVKVTTLASTDTTNINNIIVIAKALYSVYDLAYFRDLVNSGENSLNAKVMNNINLENICSDNSGHSWIPIGNYKASNEIGGEVENLTGAYKGVFDGNNKDIQNLNIYEPALYRQAMFGSVQNGTIKNLNVFGNVYAYQGVGGICGYCINSNIINCTNYVEITLVKNAGAGIVGANDKSTISRCINQASIHGNEVLGGICGRNGENSTIENCKSIGEKIIEGKAEIGGICGINEAGAKIQNCYNELKVKSNGAVLGAEGEASVAGLTGGIVGRNDAIITRCENKGNITASYRVTGGITGRNRGTVSYCHNSGSVEGEMASGGIVGNNRGNISYVYNTASEIKSSDSTVGGISGNQNSSASTSIQYAYNSGKISGANIVGGIVGELEMGKVNYTYNVGTINASTNTHVGQVVGYGVKNPTNSSYTTYSDMITWSQETIQNKIGNFTKRTNNLPILNITILNNAAF